LGPAEARGEASGGGTIFPVVLDCWRSTPEESDRTQTAAASVQ